MICVGICTALCITVSPYVWKHRVLEAPRIRQRAPDRTGTGRREVPASGTGGSGCTERLRPCGYTGAGEKGGDERV